MKKVFMFLFWRVLYKKALSENKRGYHCAVCEADCEYFDCPCKPDEMLIKRFK